MGMVQKVSLIARRYFELAYVKAAVQYIIHLSMGTSSKSALELV